MSSKAENEVKVLRQLIEDDGKWRENWSFREKWSRFEDYYRGRFTGKGIVPINLYFPYLRGTIPQVYFRNPSISIAGNQPATAIKARILEAITRLLISQLGIKREMKASAQDVWMFGTGFLVHGYDSEFGWVGADDVEAKGGVALDGTHIEYNTSVIPGMPWTLRSHPVDITVAWGTVSSRDIRRYTIRKRRLLEDIKSDPKYTSSVAAKVTHDKAKPLLDYEGREDTDLHEEWAYVYETHDLRERRVKTITDGVDAFLRNDTDTLVETIGGPSITPIVWNPSGSSLWGVPDAEILDGIQKNANDANTQITKERRADLVRVLALRGLFTPEEAAKFVSEEVWPVIFTEEPPGESDLKVLSATNRAGAYMELEAIKAQALQAIGMPRTRAGEYTAATKRTTGTEVRAVEYGGDIRADDKRDALADALVESVKAWHNLIFSLWKKPRIIYAPYVAPPFSWIIFKGPTLKASYSYQVQPEELRPVTEETRRQEAMIVGPKLLEAARVVPGLDARAVFRQVLSRFPDWNINEAMPPVQGEIMPPGLVGMLTPEGTIQGLKEVGNAGEAGGMPPG